MPAQCSHGGLDLAIVNVSLKIHKEKVFPCLMPAGAGLYAREVQAMALESLQRPTKGPCPMANSKQNRGFIVASGGAKARRNNQKARGIVAEILNVSSRYLQPVHIRSHGPGNGRCSAALARSSCARRLETGMLGAAARRSVSACIDQNNRMTVNPANAQACCQQMMGNRKIDFRQMQRREGKLVKRG